MVQYAYGHFMGFKRPRTDVGVTQTDAIHYFDLFNYLFGGPPQAVTAVVRHYLDLPLDDTSISVLEYGKKLSLWKQVICRLRNEETFRLSETGQAFIAISKKLSPLL